MFEVNQICKVTEAYGKGEFTKGDSVRIAAVFSRHGQVKVYGCVPAWDTESDQYDFQRSDQWDFMLPEELEV